MATGKKTGGKNFEKGQVANPNGRPRLPEYLKKARVMNKQRFEEILLKYIDCNAKELKESLLNPETKAIDLIVIKVLLEAIKHGDEKRLGFLLDRLIGKVKEEIEVTGTAYTGLMEIIKRKNAK